MRQPEVAATAPVVAEAAEPTADEGIEGIGISHASPRLILTALGIAGAVAAAMFYLWVDGHSSWAAHEQVSVLVLSAGLVYLGIIDGFTRRISNTSTILAGFTAVSLLVFAWISGSAQEAVTGAIIGVLIGIILVAGYLFSPIKKLGGGDVKLIPSVVAVLASLHVLSPSLWLLFTLLFALAAAVILKRMGKRPVVTLAPMMALALIPTFWHFSQISWAILL